MHGTESAECPLEEIAAYLDGELSGGSLAEFEGHLKQCSMCRKALNEQKRFLSALSASLTVEGTAELPADLTKRLIVNAESSVVGLRHQNERFTAIFISVTLFLFILFALGNEALSSVGFASSLGEKAIAVTLFFGKLVWIVGLALSVVLKSLTSNIGFQEVLLPFGFFAAAAAMLMLYNYRPRRKSV